MEARGPRGRAPASETGDRFYKISVDQPALSDVGRGHKSTQPETIEEESRGDGRVD